MIPITNINISVLETWNKSIGNLIILNIVYVFIFKYVTLPYNHTKVINNYYDV